MKKIHVEISVLVLAGAACLTAGCSRSEMNYEIAESIGTVGKYPDNAPVETPKMRDERLQSEAVSEAEAKTQEILEKASDMAAMYEYDEAIEYLNSEKNDENSEDIQDAITEYTNAKAELVLYEGSIPHLSFPTLIEDPQMAFDGDENSATYESSMVTVDEFTAMLQSLYDRGYVLIRMEDIADFTENEDGSRKLTQQELYLPADKKPIVISQDNLNYEGVKNGDGIATRLVLDESGQVKAQYTDSDGHDKKGDYDLVPVLNSFIEEHPDFSYHGAHGIVSVSGSNGVFGYDLDTSGAQTESTSSSEVTGSEEQTESEALTDDEKMISLIADALREEGWEIACAGYSHSYMNDMSLEQLTADITSWKDQAGKLVGDTDILLYPYGGEVSYPGDSLDYLLENGFVYLCGLWGDQDYLEIQDSYMRQTRRFVDGYTLDNTPDYFTDFFNVSELINSYRQQSA